MSKTGRKPSLWLIFVLGAAATVCLTTACNLAQTDDVWQLGDVKSNPPSKQPVQRAQKFNTEEEWMVDSTARDIAETLIFAANKDRTNPPFTSKEIAIETKTVNKEKGTYLVTYKDTATTLNSNYQFTIQTYLWAPENYVPLASQIIKEEHLTPQPVSKVPEDFLKQLGDGDMKVFIEENKRVSSALTAHPLDASLHEQAAMLIAKFNMEESAEDFTEDRPQFARGCTHLAIARALNGGKLSQLGQLAEVALELMTGRDGMVQERLDALAKSSKDKIFLSWMRALKIRATSDLRLYNLADHTAVEEGQYVMRMTSDQNGDVSLHYVQENKRESNMYLQRVLGACCRTVEGGHEILSQIVPRELESFEEDYEAYTGKKAETTGAILGELNLSPTRCLNQNPGEALQLNVISWDDLAAFHNRHLLGAIGSEYYYYNHLYGVKEEARKTEDRARKYFGNNILFPLLLTKFYYEHREMESSDALDRCHQLQLTQPELITSSMWCNIKLLAESTAPATVLVSGKTWFDPALPRGTAFFYYSRNDFGNLEKNDKTLTEVRKLCPFIFQVNRDWAKNKYGDYPTGAQYEEAFGAMKDYNLEAQELISFGNVSDPQKFTESQLKLGRKDPMAIFNLANYMAKRGKEEEAREYYEKARKECENSVAVANQSEWLMKYYLKKGDKKRAQEIAEEAHEVYSAYGLDCMAKYHEFNGEIDKAHDVYKEEAERYQDERLLDAFYVRHADKNKEWADKAEKAIRKAYLSGVKKVTLTDFTGPPQSGILVKWADPYVRDVPPLKGDVIVALNSYPVINITQYWFAKDLQADGKMKVIYWDTTNKVYKEIDRHAIEHNLLGLQIEPYKSNK